MITAATLAIVVGLSEIEAAGKRLASVIRPTELIYSHALSGLAGRAIYVKPEHLQRTGSFKIRGAYNFLRLLVEAGDRRPVVAASAGNHAQGVALAASLCGVPATIYMPVDASIPKVAATRGYGAEVILEGDSVSDSIELARRHARERGAVFVPPFDDPAIVAGQGTVGLELARGASDATQVLVPVGGGGLIAGVATALKELGRDIEVIGVQAAAAPSMAQALRAHHPLRVDLAPTMADGIAVAEVSALTLQLAERYVNDVVVVEEEEISQAVLTLLERSKWLVEPAGAVGLAALLSGKLVGEGPAIVVLSGGNIDPLLLTRLIEHGLSAAGRYVIVRVVLTDRPGALARLTSTIAELGMNVLSVEHHRSGARVAVDEVEVLLTLETRGPSHRDEIVPALAQGGFRASVLS